MSKEVVVQIYNGILLNHKKECIWVSSNKVDEPAYYIKVSQKKKSQYHMLMHMCVI